jgi:hypothetical protein
MRVFGLAKRPIWNGVAGDTGVNVGYTGDGQHFKKGDHMPFKRKLRWLLLAVLAISTLPLGPITAQGDLPEDARAALDRVLSAIDAAAEYESYTVVAESDWEQAWTAGVGGQVMAGETQQFSQQDELRYQLDAASMPNIRQAFTVENTVLDAAGQTLVDYVAEGEFRAVDEAFYVRAAYTNPSPDLAALPASWIDYNSAISPRLWPGLDWLNIGAFEDMLAGAAPAWALGSRIDGLDATFAESATTATVMSDQLADGTLIDRVDVTFMPQAAADMGLYFDLTQQLDRLIFEAIEGEPLSVQFYLDQSGQLVGMAYDLTFELADLDLSATISDAPPGFMFNVQFQASAAIHLSDINAPLELAAAPPVTGLAELPAFRAPEPAGELAWWNDRVFYEVFVRSFYDSGDDGNGDLRGLIEKLDYLNDGDPATTSDLGVTGLWLMPITQSPTYHGYDTFDYYTVEADYGTNDDFHALIDAAHERGMVVIVDLMLNHTSSEHPWFLASAAGDPEYIDWYIWSNDPPEWYSPWGSPVWHQNGDQYFFGLFWEGMPDLNYAHPPVSEAMNEVIRFWLEDMDADGFRLDAIRHLIEDGPVMENTPATLDWLVGFHDFVKAIEPEALTIGEIWDTSEAVVPYVGDRTDIAFEFDLAQATLDSVRWGVADFLILAQDTVLGLYPTGQYATFLTNHDMDRVLSQLGDDEPAARVAASSVDDIARRTVCLLWGRNRHDRRWPA